jgi:hypothetical protein
MMYGVRPNAHGLRVVKDRDNGNAVINLANKTVQEIRDMLAQHIVSVWDSQNSWARHAIRMHVEHEARSYLNMHNADLAVVRDAYCDAIRGVNGHAPIYGDPGVQLAFASRFQATVLCWLPPRRTAERSRGTLFRPLMYGSHQAARDAGEHANRTACLMLMYVLVAGVGHAMPLRARQARDGRPGRFTGALRHSSSIASLRRHRQCFWQLIICCRC